MIRRHSEPEDLHEYYISLKQASWKAIEKIEADFGWEKKGFFFVFFLFLLLLLFFFL